MAQKRVTSKQIGVGYQHKTVVRQRTVEQPTGGQRVVDMSGAAPAGSKGRRRRLQEKKTGQEHSGRDSSSDGSSSSSSSSNSDGEDSEGGGGKGKRKKSDRKRRKKSSKSSSSKSKSKKRDKDKDKDKDKDEQHHADKRAKKVWRQGSSSR